MIESVHITEEVSRTETVNVEVGLLSYEETVLMQTALTEVKGKESKKCDKVRFILDSGSHRA